jgi:phosphoribosyl-AMP cyclohydrolase
MRDPLSGFFVFVFRREGNMTIDFAKMGGLVPAIVQDENTREVLMLGFMNPESLRLTLATGFATFYSRTRQRLWTKGETSGNRLQVISASLDCDCDTVLLRVRVHGDGLACHQGTPSCFTQSLSAAAEEVVR